MRHTSHCAAVTDRKVRYSLRIDILAIPTYIRPPPLGGRFRSEYCQDVWYGKSRMVCLPDSEKNVEDVFILLTESTNATDTRTDRVTDTA